MQKKITNDFKDALRDDHLMSNDQNLVAKHVNTYSLSVALGVIMISIVVISKKQQKKLYIWGFVFFILGSILFTIGYYVLCLFTFEEVICFARYMSTIFTAWVMLLFLILVNGVLEQKKDMAVIGLYLTIILVVVYPFSKTKVYNVSLFNKYRADSMGYVHSIRENALDKNTNIVFVYNKEHKDIFTNQIYHLNIYFQLIEDGYKYISEEYVDNQNDIQNVIDKYDYLYFIAIKYDDLSVFENVTGEKFEKSGLYKVVEIDNNRVLESMN